MKDATKAKGNDHCRLSLPESWRECLSAMRRALGDVDCKETVLDLYLTRLTREAMINLAWLKGACVTFKAPSPWPVSHADLCELPVTEYSNCLLIGQHEVMHRWQAPLMEALASNVCVGRGDILEIGFGLGIASDAIQRCGVKSHTIIEGHPEIFRRLTEWAKAQGKAEITTLFGVWADLVPKLQLFDGLLFDPYPWNENEYQRYWLNDITFAAHFFPVAASLLRPDGRFTYYSNEIDSVSREHQRRLLRHFRQVEIGIVDALNPPEYCQYWWAPTIVTVTAIK